MFCCLTLGCLTFRTSLRGGASSIFPFVAQRFALHRLASRTGLGSGAICVHPCMTILLYKCIIIGFTATASISRVSTICTGGFGNLSSILMLVIQFRNDFLFCFTAIRACVSFFAFSFFSGLLGHHTGIPMVSLFRITYIMAYSASLRRGAGRIHPCVTIRLPLGFITDRAGLGFGTSGRCPLMTLNRILCTANITNACFRADITDPVMAQGIHNFRLMYVFAFCTALQGISIQNTGGGNRFIFIKMFMDHSRLIHHTVGAEMLEFHSYRPSSSIHYSIQLLHISLFRNVKHRNIGAETIRYSKGDRQLAYRLHCHLVLGSSEGIGHILLSKSLHGLIHHVHLCTNCDFLYLYDGVFLEAVIFRDGNAIIIRYVINDATLRHATNLAGLGAQSCRFLPIMAIGIALGLTAFQTSLGRSAGSRLPFVDMGRFRGVGRCHRLLNRRCGHIRLRSSPCKRRIRTTCCQHTQHCYADNNHHYFLHTKHLPVSTFSINIIHQCNT